MNTVVFIKHPPLHEPSPAQKEAGNYKKRKIAWQGMEISVENEPGSFRRGTNRDGQAWEQRMANAYGYLRGTQGVDGDHVDVFLGPHPDTAENVYVVHARKVNRWSEYDEDKAMLGFASEKDAREAFLANYSDPRFLGDVTTLPVAEFVAKVKATFENPCMIKAEQLSLFNDAKPTVENDKDSQVDVQPGFADVMQKLGGIDAVAKILRTVGKDRVAVFVQKLAQALHIHESEAHALLRLEDDPDVPSLKNTLAKGFHIDPDSIEWGGQLEDME